MEFRILGPLEVIADGRPVELPPQLRKLLAILLLEANRPVPSSRLAELIADKPSSPIAEGTLRSHVDFASAWSLDVLEARASS